jgi:hypothetical protein
MTQSPDQELPTYDGQVLDADLHLLDRQVLDRDDIPVSTVDDVELTEVPWGVPISEGTPAPVVSALVAGPVLATRIFGGRPPSSRLVRISWAHVESVSTVIRLGISGAGLDATWAERWVRDHIIGRIPGGRHDPE